MHELSETQRSLLAIALLLAVAALFSLSVVLPVWRYYAGNRQQIEQYRERLDRFRKLTADTEALQKQLAELKQQRAVNRLILTGKSRTLAAAALQDRVKSITRKHDADLLSTHIQPARQDGDFLQLSVNVSLRASIQALQHILYDLENGTPIIIINHALIQNPQPERQVGESSGAPSTLVVQLELAGFMHHPAGQAEPDE